MHWMKYWTVFAFFTVLETPLDFIISWSVRCSPSRPLWTAIFLSDIWLAWPQVSFLLGAKDYLCALPNGATDPGQNNGPSSPSYCAPLFGQTHPTHSHTHTQTNKHTHPLSITRVPTTFSGACCTRRSTSMRNLSIPQWTGSRRWVLFL